MRKCVTLIINVISIEKNSACIRPIKMSLGQAETDGTESRELVMMMLVRVQFQGQPHIQIIKLINNYIFKNNAQRKESTKICTLMSSNTTIPDFKQMN